MNVADTADLLTAIATRDQRTVGQSDIAAWANDLDDVALSEALDAVTAFHRSEVAQRRRIVAADIVQWTRMERRKAVEADHAMSLKAEAQVAYRQIKSGGVDPHHGARNSSRLEAIHAEAMQVPCAARPRGCGALVDERCRQTLADGSVVSTKIPHTGRSVAARRRVESGGGVSVLS